MPLKTNSEIAAVIRQLAKAQKKSLKDMLSSCEINRNFMYDLEHSNSSPSVEKIMKIAMYFGVGTEYLLGDGDIAAGLTQEDSKDIRRITKLYLELSKADRKKILDLLDGLIKE